MGQPKEKRENMDKKELKQGVGRDNLRKKEKTKGLVWAKTGGGGGCRPT